MAKQVPLSDDDRRLLGEILDILNLDNKKLAGLSKVSEPWLSQVRKGRRKSVDSQMLERVANVLVQSLSDSLADNKVSESRAHIALTFLSRYTAAAAALVPRKTHRPGGPVPVDAAHYIKRDADDEAMMALQDMPFTMMVAGPVQCGKSTLLARLEQKAREIGVETAWFDARLPTNPTEQKTRHQPDLNATAALALSELLQAQWGLERPRDDGPDSIPKLIHWLLKSLAPTASKPRLLILDDLSSLGTRAADDWLSLFVRKMDTRAITRVQMSIAVGLTHQFGQDFARKLIEISSIVHWWPKIELGWLGSDEAVKLESAVTGAASEDDDLYKLFAGQPYLTHSAAVDTDFREAVRRWTEKSTTVRARAIRNALPYKRHLTAIKFAILGPTLEPDSGTTSLLETFIDACDGRVPKDHHKELFLKKAKLLNDAGQPALPIYRLIAEDLRKTD